MSGKGTYDKNLTWNGMDELETFLRTTPGALAATGTLIVDRAAEDAAAFIKAKYLEHKVTGNLAKGVKVRARKSKNGTVVRQVKGTAPHTHLFEFGTAARHRHAGTQRIYHGSPPHAIFVPTVVAARARMNAELVNLVKTAGFVVTNGG